MQSLSRFLASFLRGSAVNLYVIGCLAAGHVRADDYASWGDKMPPSPLKFISDPDKPYKNSGYPGAYSTQMHQSTSERPASAMITVYGRDDPRPRQQLFANIGFGGEFADIDCVPLGGQIYRCSIEKGRGERGVATLTRIPNHPLAVAPEKSVGLVSILWNADLRVMSLGAGLIPLTEHQVEVNFSIDKKNVHLPDPNIAQKAPATVPVHVTYFNGKERSMRESNELTEGKTMEIGIWSFKVERIVLPDPDQHIPGWVDLRVQKLGSSTLSPKPGRGDKAKTNTKTTTKEATP